MCSSLVLCRRYSKVITMVWFMQQKLFGYNSYNKHFHASSVEWIVMKFWKNTHRSKRIKVNS